MITAKASPERLPGTTTTDLLADVQTSPVSGFSGTVVAQLSLGLPDLPGIGTSDRAGASMAGLLSGSHTMKLWYGGADRQRVALLGVTSETDVFHLGRDVWLWDSETHIATRTTLPADSLAIGGTPIPLPTSTESLSPQQVASRVLDAIRPSTVVTLGANRVVADRSAYELVLTPRDPASRVGSVHIAVDGSTKIPLGVQIYPRGKTSAAIDVAFTSVTFRTPSASYFTFTPPPGAHVRQGEQPREPRAVPRTQRVTTIGSGWTSIAEYHATPKQLASIAGAALEPLTPVSGAWGHGRLLNSALVSVLVTDDGRVFAGAVDPSALYAAATTHR
jgi:outer membrane lipoprotein-sorting protein